MRVAPRVEVDRDGSTAIAAVRQRAHVLRLTAGEAADVTRLGGETFLDATLSPDGRSVAVATGRRILILDAATLDALAQVPFEALRVVWLDRTRLR